MGAWKHPWWQAYPKYTARVAHTCMHCIRLGASGAVRLPDTGGCDMAQDRIMVVVGVSRGGVKREFDRGFSTAPLQGLSYRKRGRSIEGLPFDTGAWHACFSSATIGSKLRVSTRRRSLQCGPLNWKRAGHILSYLQSDSDSQACSDVSGEGHCENRPVMLT